MIHSHILANFAAILDYGSNNKNLRILSKYTDNNFLLVAAECSSAYGRVHRGCDANTYARDTKRGFISLTTTLALIQRL